MGARQGFDLVGYLANLLSSVGYILESDSFRVEGSAESGNFPDSVKQTSLPTVRYSDLVQRSFAGETPDPAAVQGHRQKANAVTGRYPGVG